MRAASLLLSSLLACSSLVETTPAQFGDNSAQKTIIIPQQPVVTVTLALCSDGVIIVTPQNSCENTIETFTERTTALQNQEEVLAQGYAYLSYRLSQESYNSKSQLSPVTRKAQQDRYMPIQWPGGTIVEADSLPQNVFRFANKLWHREATNCAYERVAVKYTTAWVAYNGTKPTTPEATIQYTPVGEAEQAAKKYKQTLEQILRSNGWVPLQKNSIFTQKEEELVFASTAYQGLIITNYVDTNKLYKHSDDTLAHYVSIESRHPNMDRWCQIDTEIQLRELPTD
jgi:hypothetical protein